MGKPVRKYKTVSAVYLSLALLSGGIGAYSALPAAIKDNGGKTEQLKDILDSRTDNSVISNTATNSTSSSNVTTVKPNTVAGGDVTPDASDLFEWKDTATTPQATPAPTTNTTTTTQKPITTTNTTVSDPFTNLDDPFGDTAVTTPVATPTPTQKPTTTPVPTQKPEATPTPTQKPTTTTPPTTNTGTSTNSGSLSSEVLQSILATMDIVDKNKEHGDFSSLKLDVIFKSNAMTATSKFTVNSVYEVIPNSPYYKMSYDQSANILVMEFLKELPAEGLNLNTIFSMPTLNLKVQGNPSEYLLDLSTDTQGQYIIRNVAGYNGFLQATLNNVPVVFMNAASIEPLVTESVKAEVIAQHEKVTSSENNQSTTTPTVPEINPGRPDVNTDDFFSDFNGGSTIDDFFGEINGNTGNSGNNNSNNQSNNNQSNNNNVLDQIKDDLNQQKEQNNAYKPTWGVAEKDTSGLKGNISNGKDIVSKPGAVLNVIDITGEKIDLKEATENAKPAELKGNSIITVTQEEVETELPITFYIAILITILALVMYIYYTSLYQKEYRRDLETRGLLGNVEVDDVISFSNVEIGDESEEEEFIDTDIILDQE